MAVFLDDDEEFMHNLTEKQESLLEKERVTRGTKNSKSTRLFNRFLSLWLATSICVTGYISFLSYCANRSKFFSDDNLFNGNSFSQDISDEEISNIVDNLEDELKCKISDDQIDEYCLLEAIRNNKALTEAEKEHFYKYIDLILDNPYLNKESVYRSFRNVTVQNWLFRPIGVSQITTGDYNYKNGIIRIFDRENKPLDHEGIHTMFSNEKTLKLPEYFREGMTELLSNEYFSLKPYFELSSYPFEILAIKMFCELTSSDTVLKAFTYGDMNIIAEELATMSGNLTEAQIALNGLEYYFKFFNGEEEKSESHEVIISNFMNYFDSCIITKDSNSLEKRSYFSNLALFLNIFEEYPYQAYIDDLQDYGYIRRAYFFSKLKASENDAVKTYSKSN